MAPWLVLLLGLWNYRPPDPAAGQDMEEGPVTAPPELVALLPAAAEATVAAGYIGGLPESTTTPVFTLATRRTAPGGSSSTQPKDVFLIVGDTRYAWQEWSEWHCNCEAGSMSRVRDITYSVPGVRLDPEQYDVLRFEREVCSYKTCACDPGQHQCDRLEASCARGPMHLCALRDIQQDQARKRKAFWARVHEGLQRLWDSVREAFPEHQQASQAKSKL